MLRIASLGTLTLYLLLIIIGLLGIYPLDIRIARTFFIVLPLVWIFLDDLRIHKDLCKVVEDAKMWYCVLIPIAIPIITLFSRLPMIDFVSLLIATMVSTTLFVVNRLSIPRIESLFRSGDTKLWLWLLILLSMFNSVVIGLWCLAS